MPGSYDLERDSFVRIDGYVGGEDGCRPVDRIAGGGGTVAGPGCTAVIDVASVVPVPRAEARAAMSRPERQATLDVPFSSRGWRFRLTTVRFFATVPPCPTRS